MLVRQKVHPATATLRDAIEYLASACDGAVRRDGHGFSTDHVILGHGLAEHPRWGPSRRRRARRLVRFYQQQLTRAGFDPDQILGNRSPARISRRQLQLLAASWAPDPTGVHHRRYWNGARWTQLVS